METTIYKQKTYKEKKKNTLKISVNSFCAGHLLLSTGSAFKSGLYPQWDSIGKDEN